MDEWQGTVGMINKFIDWLFEPLVKDDSGVEFLSPMQIIVIVILLVMVWPF